MQYSIGTGLIIQEFHDGCECPLCEIKKTVEKRLADEFLSDAVMDDDMRAKVNKKGFCANHFDLLFVGKSKLGLALQNVTRLNTVNKYIVKPKNLKDAKNHAKKLTEATSSCIICDYIEESMVRYYKTIAMMYYNEDSFKQTLKSLDGFCLNHYTQLINYAEYAKSSANDYINVLAEIQIANMKRIQDELQWFCDHHDYRNRSLPLGTSADALPRTRIKLYGKRNI